MVAHIKRVDKIVSNLENVLLDINHVCIKHFPNNAPKKLHVVLEEGIAALEARIKELETKNEELLEDALGALRNVIAYAEKRLKELEGEQP